MKTADFFVCCVVAALSTGCFKHSHVVGAGGDVESEPAYSRWESHWFFGIIGESELNVNEVCPSGNATIKDRVSFLNGLVGALIGIVWYPSTVKVYCDQGGAAAERSKAKETADDVDEAAEEPAEQIEDEISLTLTPEQMRRIALDPRTLEYVRKHAPEWQSELRAAIDTYETGSVAVESARL